jgi:hypothetical protein
MCDISAFTITAEAIPLQMSFSHYIVFFQPNFENLSMTLSILMPSIMHYTYHIINITLTISISYTKMLQAGVGSSCLPSQAKELAGEAAD